MRRSIPLALLLGLCVGCTAVVPDGTDALLPESPSSVSAAPTDQDAVSQPPEDLGATQQPAPTPGPDQTTGGQTAAVPRASAETIRPDPEIMATMECEVLSAATEERIYRLWGVPVETAVQVEVGEGLTPGEIWWVITYMSTSELDGRIRSDRLTNHPGNPEERGEWFILGSWVPSQDGPAYTWDNIHWDAERLARGQSALSKAHECLAEL